MTFKVELKSDPKCPSKAAMGIVIDGTMVHSCIIDKEHDWIPSMLTRVYTQGYKEGYDEGYEAGARDEYDRERGVS